jgi:hypothetical protein
MIPQIESEFRKQTVAVYVAVFAGLLIGLGVSKFEARAYYDAGFRQAIASQEKACIQWWWGGNTSALERAKESMCQTTKTNFVRSAGAAESDIPLELSGAASLKLTKPPLP